MCARTGARPTHPMSGLPGCTGTARPRLRANAEAFQRYLLVRQAERSWPTSSNRGRSYAQTRPNSARAGKNFVPRVGAVSRTGFENDNRRGPAAWPITANADDFRSHPHRPVPSWLPAVIGNVTATRTDTQRLITADASHLPHDPGWVHKPAKWIADQPAANVLERQPEADVPTVLRSLLGP
jgi:hypothetical protein